MKDPLCDWFEGSLCGKLRSAMLVSGLDELGRNVLVWLLLGRHLVETSLRM